MAYPSVSSANRAIREFDGANANGQPIRLSLLPTAPSVDIVRGQVAAARNPFDTAVKPSRSLFERIEEPKGRLLAGRSRSRSPGAPPRTNTSKPPPDNVDRYVPPPSSGIGRRRSRTGSPRRRSLFGRSRTPVGRVRRGRVGGDERERGPRMVNGRPRRTQEELDREMEDYWGSKADTNGNTNGQKKDKGAAPVVVEDDDIDMIT